MDPTPELQRSSLAQLVAMPISPHNKMIFDNQEEKHDYTPADGNRSSPLLKQHNHEINIVHTVYASQLSIRCANPSIQRLTNSESSNVSWNTLPFPKTHNTDLSLEKLGISANIFNDLSGQKQYTQTTTPPLLSDWFSSIRELHTSASRKRKRGPAFATTTPTDLATDLSSSNRLHASLDSLPSAKHLSHLESSHLRIINDDASSSDDQFTPLKRCATHSSRTPSSPPPHALSASSAGGSDHSDQECDDVSVSSSSDLATTSYMPPRTTDPTDDHRHRVSSPFIAKRPPGSSQKKGKRSSQIHIRRFSRAWWARKNSKNRRSRKKP